MKGCDHMNDFYLVSSDIEDAIIELDSNSLIFWDIDIFYTQDICENCNLFGIDSSFEDELYHWTLECCPNCKNGSNLIYNPTDAPMKYDELKKYLGVGDCNGFKILDNVDSDICEYLKNHYFCEGAERVEVRNLGSFFSIQECRKSFQKTIQDGTKHCM